MFFSWSQQSRSGEPSEKYIIKITSNTIVQITSNTIVHIPDHSSRNIMSNNKGIIPYCQSSDRYDSLNLNIITSLKIDFYTLSLYTRYIFIQTTIHFPLISCLRDSNNKYIRGPLICVRRFLKLSERCSTLSRVRINE